MPFLRAQIAAYGQMGHSTVLSLSMWSIPCAHKPPATPVVACMSFKLHLPPNHVETAITCIMLAEQYGPTLADTETLAVIFVTL